MGAIQIGDQQVLVTVDQLVDGIHFDLASTPLEKIARKAMTRNLSDVAAMAAKPVGAVAAACLPKGFGDDRASSLFDHMRQVAQSYDCPLIGGDISIWGNTLLLTVTVLAQPEPGGPVLRSGAQVGDVICVTGRLGGSTETVEGYTHYLDFEPRLEVATALVSDPVTKLHSMIDISDGLAKDVENLCQASGLAAELWTDRLPVSDGARAASDRDGLPVWEHVLGDGEDYELCFTVSESVADSVLPDRIVGVPITQVGRIVETDDGPRVRVVLPDETTRSAQGLGWEHRG